MTSPPTRSPLVDRTLAAIGQLEEQARLQQSTWHRCAGAIGEFAGSSVFILLQAALFCGWIWLNRRGSGWQFDPFPHSWLMLVLALEAIFVSTFVLINQHQMHQRAERRAHVNLQFNLLMEAETTKVLSMLQELREHLGMRDTSDDDELRDLARRTEVQQVVEAIDEQLAGSTTSTSTPL